MRLPRLVFLAVVAAGLLAGPAAADLLVTREGEVVRTRGAWEVRGRLVRFTDPEGVLRALRLADVDLEESERRSRSQARQPSAPTDAATAAQPAARKAVLVLTDADVGHVSQAPPLAAASPGADPGRAPGPAAALEVGEWAEVVDDAGVEIRGTLRNRSQGLVAGVSLAVDLVGDDGAALESAIARLDRRSLAAGESTAFSASFASLGLFREVRFRPRGSELAPASAAEGGASPTPADVP